MSSSKIPSARFALVPAATSHTPSDPEFDARLIDVCARVAAAVPNVDCLDLLSVDQSLPKSRSGARLGPNAVFQHLVVAEGYPLHSYDYVFIFDDVLTTGAHFKACQAALSRTHQIPTPGGLFWARSESPSGRQ